MKKLRKLWIATALFPVMLAAGWLALPKPPPLDGVSWSQRVLDRDGHLLRLTLSADEKYRLYTPLNRIASELVEATLLHEDQHFRQHPGINPIAALRSAWYVCLGHSGHGGASTITMQLARLRYGLHTKSAHGKLVQM